MARRKAVSDLQEMNANPPLMLPSPRVTHKREHEVDPYPSLPGAMPTHTKVEPLNRKMTATDLAKRDEARAEQKMLGERYNRYLDAMAEFKGDQEQALADVFGLSPEEVRPQRLALQNEVCRGIGTSDVGDVLVRNDLALAARASILRRWAYSDNAAASLKAADLAGELEGERASQGSFESFLRLAKQAKG